MNTYRTLKKYTHTKIKELKTVETNNSSPLVTAGAKLGESLRPEVKVTAVGRLDPGCPPPLCPGSNGPAWGTGHGEHEEPASGAHSIGRAPFRVSSGSSAIHTQERGGSEPSRSGTKTP